MTDSPQLEAPAAERSIFEQVAALAKPLIVRIDKSRDIAEVHHGDSTPDDRHANVFYFQDGLPYDSRGHLIWDHPDVENNPKLKAKAEKLLKRAIKLLATAPGDVTEDDDDEAEDRDENDEDEDEDDPVTLNDMVKWVGETKSIQWQEISNYLARKYGIRVTNKKAALELLVAKQVVSPAAMSRKNRRLLEAE